MFITDLISNEKDSLLKGYFVVKLRFCPVISCLVEFVFKYLHV